MVATPKWRFEYNLNTLVILFGSAHSVRRDLGEGERQTGFAG
ncbi:hypothetical protein ACVMB3_004513 [Sinorhizobium meliloti]|nr:hypothetical protein SAMN04244576_06572 [Sinorhizobium meliloti]